MHNGYQHYLKLGMYRHPEITTENRLDIRDVSIETLKNWPIGEKAAETNTNGRQPPQLTPALKIHHCRCSRRQRSVAMLGMGGFTFAGIRKWKTSAFWAGKSDN